MALDTSRIPFGSFFEKNDDFEPGRSAYGFPEEENESPWFELFVVFLVFASGLVFVRYACIFFIDAAILCRYRRRLGRRDVTTETPAADPTAPGNGNGNGNDDNANANENSNRGNALDVELAESNRNAATKRSLDRLTPAERTKLFSSVLECREATELDLGGRRDVAERDCERDCEFATATPGESVSEPRGANGNGNGNGTAPPSPSSSSSSSLAPDRSNEGSGSGSGACCPICIQDIQVGDGICRSRVCSHVFHLDCIVDWLSTGSTLCPYCRRVILTEAMLAESLRKLRRAS